MGITKSLNLKNIFIFLFFVIFPFGQMIRIGILQPIDVIAGMGAGYAILAGFKRPALFKHFENFLFIAVFSWIFGALLFGRIEVFYGLLYLLRFSAYLYFFVYVWNFAKSGVKNKKLLIDSLLAVSCISALLGWIQFSVFPDIKPLFIWGWDMHLLRVVGTFLDPTFLGLIIVFGLIISITRLVDMKRKTYLFITAFLLMSLAFTYSRASYLALFTGLIVIARQKNFLRKAFYLILGFVLVILLLPTSRNHSIELFRGFSAIARVENYQTTLKIFSKSPVLGIGYDNMCIAYQKFIAYQPFESHACSGSDSSLLFILATTGIAGFMAFLFTIYRIHASLAGNSYLIILNSSAAALLIHSLFSNSMFYPWIAGWVLVLLAVTVKKSGSEV